ncbi:DNA polymerase alpha catalytic subunit [Teleopsis dalmanni]|uniref:DNA polymerase alpha catalytic subunit n=1 Tax=Teleopsis dalmanni TaxID=139649 RepID=UPI0018CFC37A|nr:DNA polymerase alpha catalytic subunit [Teleopsis dalmanni]
MSDSPSEPRAKRARVDKGGRIAAFEKLKKLKGNKHKYEVSEEVDNVYEIVDEREYVKKAKERYGDGWIEEDGTGYAEDGRDFFEDEDYSDEEGQSSKNIKKGGKKRLRDGDKPAKGKASIRNLFSNAVPRKLAAVSLKDDNILADILGEIEQPGVSTNSTTTPINDVRPTKIIAPAKIVSNITKKSEAAAAKEYMASFINNIKAPEKPKKTEETSDDELLNRVLKPKSMEENRKTAHIPKKNVEITAKTLEVRAEAEKNASPAKVMLKKDEISAKEKSEKSNNEADNFANDDMDFSCLHDEENQFEEEISQTVPETPKPIKKPVVNEVEDMHNLLSNWESICQMDDFEEEKNSTNVALAQDNLKFWFWEAWEDAIKLPGEVFLFGRMADGKSICVRVEKIDRVLYLLPREYLLDPISKEPTRQKVTTADMYKEFDEDISNSLKLDTFRSRKVTKNFAYHSIGIDVPQVCDYLEVQYDGKKPAPNIKKKFNSIAHIFGVNTTALERFLLGRKIKGPCWLTLKQFKVNTVPISWCKTDVIVSDQKFVMVSEDAKPAPPPPLTLLALNVRTSLNPKTLKNEICMISMLVNNNFHIDKPAPQPAFNRHMCGITRPATKIWPFDLKLKLLNFKSTRVFKNDSEHALLNWFLAQYQQIDADLIVTYDALDCQLDVITDRINTLKTTQWSRIGRLRKSQYTGKRVTDYFIGRMVCDVKHSAEECIRSRSYDLQTLCQNVLKIKDNERMDVNHEDLLDFYDTGDGVLKLISLTMQDASYVLRLMCELNIMPLALQITNICGNTMTRTLQSGRSDRNEFLLLHAFTEKNYIVPDKKQREWGDRNINTVDGDTTNDVTTATTNTTGRKKAAYSGGLVLDPIRGLYDKYVLLMDFNSLYPSIIQEYNICFTTIQQPYSPDELPQLPDGNVEQGILPQQLRRLVESRREVKKLMAAPDLSPELQMQYHIRQMALKLTANSMYGCLGFGQSRFFAQHLAALVTYKGREILTNTKSLVQKLNYEVVYGDTDSIMVNTNILDYEQVFKIGHNIKQSVNKMYKQVELDIDGVFSCLLLLKKKKYAAVKVTKTSKGEIKKEQEHKGLEIVRRDWSQLAIMVGKVVLDEVLSEKQLDEKLDAVHAHLEKVKTQVLEGAVPYPMFLITKQLSKAPAEFNNTSSQPHVQVALRMNTTRNRRYKKGDMVNYIICNDGTSNPATQRAYHMDELKSSETLKIDTNYYLAHQIHPVVTRMVDVLEGTDASRIADCLGLDPTKYRAAVQRSNEEHSENATGESLVKTTLQKYRECEKFKFTCISCKTENIVAAAFKPSATRGYEAILQNCVNTECNACPYQYVVSIRNKLLLSMRSHIKRFYQNWLVCDDPSCNQNTRNYSHVTSRYRPVCLQCKNGSMIRQYSERDLFNQLSYFQYMFDLQKYQHKNVSLTPEIEQAYRVLRETVDQQLEKSAYCTISMANLFSGIKSLETSDEISHKKIILPSAPIAMSLDDE